MRLYRFEYSCYARKVQLLLDLIGRPYELRDVPYGDRAELVALTGGYLQVPVLVDDDGAVFKDSRAICARLVSRDDGAWLVPDPWAGPIWAYSDWCDGPLEDPLFRLAAPGVRARFAREVDRAMYTYVKERRYGAGCVEQWARDADALAATTRELLAPTGRTLARQPFLFGARPSLADATLYGQLAMARYADARLPASLGAWVEPWMARLEAAAAAAPSSSR